VAILKCCSVWSSIVYSVQQVMLRKGEGLTQSAQPKVCHSVCQMIPASTSFLNSSSSIFVTYALARCAMA
jgi:hypothetical protein